MNNNKRDRRKLQIEIVLYVNFPTWESDAHDPTQKKKKKIQTFGISISRAKDLSSFFFI